MILTKKYLFVILFFFLAGAGLYYFNFERHTYILTQLGGSTDLVHYEAPVWDPFPHTLKVIIDTDDSVQIILQYSGAIELEETVTGSSLEKEWIVNPGEKIDARLEYNEGVSGEVKTVLWCDSWSYAALLLVMIGFLLLTFSVYKNVFALTERRAHAQLN
jgi:hypothetical protein